MARLNGFYRTVWNFAIRWTRAKPEEFASLHLSGEPGIPEGFLSIG
jgi:hypothetical protein